MLLRHELSKAADWLAEHGFHPDRSTGETIGDYATSFCKLVYPAGANRFIRCWLVPETEQWAFRAYAGLYQSPVFDTPWAALAAAELAGWEAEVPRVAGPLVLMQRHLDLPWERVDTGQWVESVDGKITASVEFMQDTEVMGAEVAGVQFHLPHYKRLGAGDTLNLTLTVSAN